MSILRDEVRAKNIIDNGDSKTGIMTVFAFDRDKTVETNKGPIKLERIRRLKKEGNPVYCIGNPKLCDEAEIPMAPGDTKPERMRNLREKHPDEDEYIIIDDMKFESEGWKYLTPREFKTSPY